MKTKTSVAGSCGFFPKIPTVLMKNRKASADAFNGIIFKKSRLFILIAPIVVHGPRFCFYKNMGR